MPVSIDGVVTRGRDATPSDGHVRQTMTRHVRQTIARSSLIGARTWRKLSHAQIPAAMMLFTPTLITRGRQVVRADGNNSRIGDLIADTV